MKIKKVITLFVIAVLTVGFMTGCDSNKKRYDKATKLFNSGEYEQAAAEFEALGDYEDAAGRAKEARKFIMYILKVENVVFSIEKKMDYVDFTDIDGDSVRMLSTVDDWFENAVVIQDPLEEMEIQVRLGKTREGNTGIVLAEGSVIRLVFEVDSSEYPISLGVGSQFVTRKTDMGYILLPEETVKLSPAPSE